MAPLHVVLGATGGIGAALVSELAASGHRVRAVARGVDGATSADGVEVLRADLADPAVARRAVDGASVVYHAAQPPLDRWLTDFEPLTDSIARAAEAQRAKLVFVDNLYAYGPQKGMLEETTPPRPAGPKARLRLRMAQGLLDRHACGDAHVTIGRASDVFGPGVEGSALGDPVFGDALRGKTVRYLGPLDLPHTMSYTPDVARALIRLGECDAADGAVWHLPAAPPASGRELAGLIGDVLGRKVTITPTGAVGFGVASLFVPVLRQLRETRYQWQQPFVADASRFQASLGPLTPTPLADAVASTVAAWRATAETER